MIIIKQSLPARACKYIIVPVATRGFFALLRPYYSVPTCRHRGRFTACRRSDSLACRVFYITILRERARFHEFNYLADNRKEKYVHARAHIETDTRTHTHAHTHTHTNTPRIYGVELRGWQSMHLLPSANSCFPINFKHCWCLIASFRPIIIFMLNVQ